MNRNEVNVPSDPKVKEADINRKLQLYGIYSAFKIGKVPSNKQIDVALNSLLASDALSSPPSSLSPEGHILIKDVRDVIENAKKLILVKNEGNLIQEFIWDVEHIGERSTTPTPGVSTDKDAMKTDLKLAAEGVQTLFTLLVTNGQFRKLLRDVTILMRDMASDAAQRAAGKIKPSEEEMSGIDEPAEENVWHDKPDLSTANIKSQVNSQVGKRKEKATKDVQDTAEAAESAAHPTGPEGGVDATSGATAGAQAALEKVSEDVPEETKTRSRELTEKAKEFLQERMPKERRDQTIWRLKRMIVEIQGHPDYQQAIETLLSLAETFGGHGKGVSQEGASATRELVDENKDAMKKLQLILERFANSSSMDNLFDYIENFYHAANEDPRLKDWFRSVNSFTSLDFRKCLQEQGFILEDSANEQWNSLYDEGQFLLRARYRENTDNIVDEIKFLGDQFDQDPLNKELGNSLQKLFHNLGYDDSGKMVFKEHLVKDVTSIILPSLFEKIRYVPLPRIEVSDPMVDVVVENLVLEGDNLLPNVVEFSSDNYWRWGRKRIASKHTNKVMIAATGIQTDWRDVSYYIKKKTGFPGITDTGVMDILMGGEGFNFRISGLTSDSGDNLFKLENISVNIKNLQIKIKKSNHKLLFTIFKPLLYGAVRPAVEKVLEQQIRDCFIRGDRFAYAVHSEAQRAWKAARSSPQESQTIYSYYVDAVRKQVMAMRKKAAEKKGAVKERDTKVNLTATERTALFQHIKLPGGISSKVTEYEELAAKGDKWESPVFSIGDAAESTNLPQLAPIARKPRSRPKTRDSGIGSVDETISRDDQDTGKRGIGGTQLPSGPHMVPEANIRV
ncbi:conserved hypothetical protein [Histoplasma capsulatum G186AR]|uniref:Bactericidal permeability-increasing protein n=1 Tax=Ajellomyces capsulatus (strain G186AR / H82 / ATCC MYA-2454 / RMSCC 2432) TaxID=447093 RepID=C0NY03_AJECG|nr:uncharacterized protein HCBG_07797 [Histoplasma capsulatum G186AR]EEH03671.1 conserved hypothetical protein [Histoplasma capsulatum G186AR]